MRPSARRERPLPSVQRHDAVSRTSSWFRIRLLPGFVPVHQPALRIAQAASECRHGRLRRSLPRPCNCGFGKLGFDTTIGNIRSYEKLTGEGVTFVDTDFIQIIEKELPETFGGKSTDYQLVEDEDEQGFHGCVFSSARASERFARSRCSRLSHGMRGAEDRAWAQPGTEMWKQSGMVRPCARLPSQPPAARFFRFN